MLESINLKKKTDKNEFKEAVTPLELRLSRLQRQAKAMGIPIIIIFEGWGAAGKGVLINRFIQPLDPRGFKVLRVRGNNEDEQMHPLMWKYWTRTPAKGRINIFDTCWYSEIISKSMNEHMSDSKLAGIYQQALSFEKQLTDDGNLIIKFFLHISSDEQKKRFKKLESMPETKWRVTSADWDNHKHYKDLVAMYDNMIENTDVPYAPWNIIEATDKRYAALKVMTLAADILENAIAEREKKAAQKNDAPAAAPAQTTDDNLRTSVLAGVDLNKTLTRAQYRKKIEALQNEISILHSELYRRRIPVVLAFEGWDAGGKGGAIKRLTENMDPRGYEVVPTSSPNDIEKSHHYLWRFWEKMPKDGHIAIFDRTWYGRVMVERIEHFCTEDEWKRAYSEINQMEYDLYAHGAVVLKFWLHIDKDEQERRFKERMENPEKQWKITDEDWRNRDKWDEYVKAVDEMILRTSTTYAPWIIVEGNSKYYARVKVLESVVDAIKKRLKEDK